MLLSKSNWLGLCFAAAASTSPQLHGQDIDVRAGGTEVQVDGGGVVDIERAPVVANETVQTAAVQRMNHEIAAWLMADQQSIVDLANFGMQRTKSTDVSQFAGAVVRDHQTFAEKLRGLPNLSADPIENNVERRQSIRDQRQANEESREANRETNRDAVRDRDGVRRPLENLADRIEDGAERVTDRAEQLVESTREAIDRNLGTDRPARLRAMGDSHWVSIHEEIAKKLNAGARRDLEQRSGYEFDAAFVGMMIASHLQQTATLEVLSRHGSPELQRLIDEALVTVNQHRNDAERLMGTIKRHP